MTKKFLSLSLILLSTLFLTACSIPNSSITQITPSPIITSISTTSNNKISYPCIKGKTAFDSLSDGGNKMEFQQSSLGKMITSINGITQDNGKYWQYSINNKYAEVGADAYQCQGGEIITWELK